MPSKTAYILIVLIWTCGIFSCGRDSKNHKSNFSLSITTYNHAEQIFNGTMKYNLTNNILTIHRTTIFSDKDTILLSKKIPSNSIKQIANIKLDNLKDFYFNYCIMATSGSEYRISTTTDKITKNVSLHHYYDKQVESLINELNENIPTDLKIRYLTNDTKQDCKM